MQSSQNKSVVSIFWVFLENVLQTEKEPDFCELPKDKNSAFPLNFW